MLPRRLIPAVALLLASPLLGGCLDAMATYEEFDPDQHYRNPGVFEGEYRLGQDGSLVLQGGPYQAGEPEVVRLVSARPAQLAAADAATPATVYIPMAIWKPLNFTGRMPIVVDAGPYYEVFQHCRIPTQQPCAEFVNDTLDWPSQSTPLLLANVLPHGYAVVQLAVRGTGTAGGCMDLMGPDEQGDLLQALEWLGTQEWSNGRIGMIGVSYDGSTPWEAAAGGSPYLKTIVPTSGLPDIYDLMFHNGSAETRGATMHSGTYWGYGFDDDFPQNPGLPEQVPWLPPSGVGQANGREDYQDIQNLCASAATGAAMGPIATASGSRMSQVSTYWTERDYRQRVLDNYEGSVFLVHGLQDWNVDPHAAIPFNAALRAKGLEMKEWYGQWDHANPDSWCASGVPQWITMPCRLDFAEILLRWLERHLKEDLTVDVGPSIQVQDNIGQWRNADSYPPTNAAWVEMALGADGKLGAPSPAAGRVQLMPPVNGQPAGIIELVSEPVPADLRISGLPQLKLPFQVEGAGGDVAVWMFDMDPNGNVRAPSAGLVSATPDRKPTWEPFGVPVVGHGQMNLRYYAGGEESQVLAPGTTYVAQVELEPLEVVIPEGHQIVLWVFQSSYPDHQTSPTTGRITVELGPGTIVRLPVLEADATTIFPVPGAHFPTRDNLSLMYILKPTVQPPDPATTLPLPPTQTPVARQPIKPTCQPLLALACEP